jgi:hypothetical protein
MPVAHPDWSPVIPTTTITTTATATMKAPTIFTNGYLSQWTLPFRGPKLQSIAQMSSLDHTFHILLLLSIPLLYWRARYRRAMIEKAEEEENVRWDDYELPWRTTDWDTLYGLISMSLEHNQVPTPFDHAYFSSCQERYQDPKRYALQRLVEKGIIPVYIQDGGISTDKLSSWGLKWGFPWLTIPWYVQSKRRAYFDFIVPDCTRSQVVHMCTILNRDNQHKYAYSYRKILTEHGTEKKYVYGDGIGAGRPYTGPKFPLAVGAWSPFEVFLPFLSDKVLVSAEDNDVLHAWEYVVKGYLDAVPLLHHVNTMVVRIEAGHWGHVELDAFVLNAAQEAKVTTLFPIQEVWKDAERELERCGISYEEFFLPTREVDWPEPVRSPIRDVDRLAPVRNVKVAA